jgi:uncharacterized protein YndB with AHSA1/START domain
MSTNESPSIDSFELRKEVEIQAPIAIAFQATLEQLGPDCEMPGGEDYPMKLEAWPGGRWFRDLGEGVGHLWGHVQVIKPPKLIEICGPLMMSFAATNHLQYRLTEEGDLTRLTLVHRSMGVMVSQYQDDLFKGWSYWVDHIAKIAESKAGK